MKPNKMTSEERVALAEKMDAELDQFMEDLAANQENNSAEEKKPFDFEEWCKKIDQHPAFMTRLDEAALTGEYSETLQALQALKYSTDDGEDLRDSAAQHKDEGNKHFKLGKYRWAVDCYTSGIKLCCDDPVLNSVLYSNRAAAQKRLGNRRSALRDCVSARRFDPSNGKAIVRGAECLLEMGYGKQCTEWIVFNAPMIQDSSQVRSLEELQGKARQLTIAQDRDARQQRALVAADDENKRALLKAFQERNLSFKPKLRGAASTDEEVLFDWADLEVRIGQFDKIPVVYLDPEQHQLAWPLLLQYPEVGQTDFLTDCLECTPFNEVLAEVMESVAQWDPLHNFRIDNVRLFVALDVFEEECVSEVNFEQCLKEVLSLPDVVIMQGLPVIQVYTKSHVKGRMEKLAGNRLRFNKKKENEATL